MVLTPHTPSPRPFEVRFDSLSVFAGALAFPCDEAGRVDLDALSERERNNYFYARAMQGRQYAIPRIVPCRNPAPLRDPYAQEHRTVPCESMQRI